jgi:hypothetical protein
MNTGLYGSAISGTQLRRRENYSAKSLYVLDNAVHAKLVAQAEDWPFQGG